MRRILGSHLRFMSTSSESYSPAQYLDAGFRAEMAGERDLAIQYYSYIADAFPDTLEGEAARGGLMRLGQDRGHRKPSSPNELAPQSQWPAGAAAGMALGSVSHGHGTPGPAHPSPDRSRVEAGERSAFSSQGRSNPQASPVRHAMKPTAGEDATQAAHRIRLGEIAHMDLGRGIPPGQHVRSGTERPDSGPDGRANEPMRLPEVVARHARVLAGEDEDIGYRPRYTNARRLAYVVTIFGWLIVAGGLSLLVLTVLGVAAPVPGHVGGIAVGVVIGGVAGVMGLALVLGGLVAVAIFDQADAVRELRSLVKVRAEL